VAAGAFVAIVVQKLQFIIFYLRLFTCVCARVSEGR
jgi:hypothetical protein